MSRLSQILEDQLAIAQRNAGTRIIRRLKGGLRIELVTVSNEVRLTLARDDKYPSLQEWVTVMAHWPYPVMKVTAAPKRRGSRYTVSARLVPSTMMMKF